MAKLRDRTKWLNGRKAIAADAVIQYLNPRVRNWAACYQHAASKRTFAYVEHRLVQILWRWAKRRRPHKGRRWIKDRYFQAVGGRRWVVAATTKDRQGRRRLLTLFQVGDTPIVRHVKVKGGTGQPRLHQLCCTCFPVGATIGGAPGHPDQSYSGLAAPT